MVLPSKIKEDGLRKAVQQNWRKLSVQLRNRVLTGAALVLFVVVIGIIGSLVAWGSGLYLVFFYLITALAAYEYARVCSNSWALRWEGIALLLIVLLAPTITIFFLTERSLWGTYDGIALGLSAAGLGLLISLALGVGLSAWLGRLELAQAGETMLHVVVGVLLVGFCGSAFLGLAVLESAWRELSWLLLVVCINDIAAYTVGRKVGGWRLAPAISPKKTVSGALGGLIAGVVAGVLCVSLSLAFKSYLVAALVAIVVVAAAQAGDLLKSLIKRRQGVKDMGGVLPGHGGVLDRVDGILMGGAVFYCFIALIVLVGD